MRPGQHEASINVTLVEVDSGKPQISDQPQTGKVTEPGKIGSPQTKIQKKQDEPTGTGPEYDCEYGLPRRDGANSEIQLTSGDLPAGLHLDDFANMNKACVVNQWGLSGFLNGKQRYFATTERGEGSCARMGPPDSSSEHRSPPPAGSLAIA